MTAGGRDVHVYKFGGTSLGDAARIRKAAALVAEHGPPPVVVVSAVAGVTDRLASLLAPTADTGAVLERLRALHLGILEELGPAGAERSAVEAAVAADLDDLAATLEATGDTLGFEGPARAPTPEGGAAGDPAEGGRAPAHTMLADRVLATGEDLSSHLVAYALRARGCDAERIDARDVVVTDARFGRARPREDVIRERARARLSPLLERGVVPVVQGFVGADADGRTTTLGRGGSDFTAAVLGAALGARRVHIWTDVDGMLSGDPRTVEAPRILEEVGFEEAVELSYFGARVLHPAAAKHAVSLGVPLHIRNSFRPRGPGTLILQDRRVGPRIAAVAYKPATVLIKVRSRPASLPYGFLARVFDVLARHRLPVDLVATSHSSTAFTIDENEEIEVVSRELSGFADVEVLRSLATVTVVGRGLLDEPGVDGRVFREVGTTPIHLISQASDVSLSFLVDEDDAPGVVRRLHRALIHSSDDRLAVPTGDAHLGPPNPARDPGVDGRTPTEDARVDRPNPAAR